MRLVSGARVRSLTTDNFFVTAGLEGTVKHYFPHWTQGLYSDAPLIEWDNDCLSIAQPETLEVIPDTRVIVPVVYRRDLDTNWSKSGPNYPQERIA